MLLCLIAVAVCALLGWRKRPRWQDVYRVGPRPSWLSPAYPTGRFVEWPTGHNTEVTARLVAECVALREELGIVLGQRVNAELDKLPAHVQAAVLTYHGHNLVGVELSPEQACRMAYTLHYVDGFKENPEDVVASTLSDSNPLFERNYPLGWRPFLEKVNDHLHIAAWPRSAGPPSLQSSWGPTLF